MTIWHDARSAFGAARHRLGYGPGADRAALATLRRLRPREDAPDRLDPRGVLSVPAAVWALSELGLNAEGDADVLGFRVERAAAVLGVLAEVRERESTHPAKALKAKGYTEARFVRLLRMETPAERLAEGRRIVRLLGGRADPGTLGADLYLWGPAARTRWAFRYHGDPPPDAIAEDRTEDSSGEAA